MPKPPLPPTNLAFVYLRSMTGITQGELAEILGVSESALSQHASGARGALEREKLEELIEPLGHEVEAIDVLLTAHELITGMKGGDEPPSPVAPTPEERREIARAALSGAALAARAMREEMAAQLRSVKITDERRRAEEVWERFQRFSHKERLALVEGSVREARSWALVELACRQSLHATSDDPARAVQLAELAVRTAGLVTGEESWLARLQAWAWAHLGNARRVASDLPAANQAFRQVWELWETGKDAEPELFPEWRILDLEASLRRAQREFGRALELLDRALTVSGGGETAGRILLNRCATLEQKGDFEQALAALEEAKPLVEQSKDPRLWWGLLFNFVVSYDHLGRYKEASHLLPRVKELAIELRRKIDLIRLRWLEGRIELSQGRRNEALVALEQVRKEFTAERLAYDTALVSLDISVLLLENNRTTDVRRLALEMRWIFKAQKVHREAMAALLVFTEAAQRETATLALARQVLEFLKQARGNPGLRFEPRLGLETPG